MGVPFQMATQALFFMLWLIKIKHFKGWTQSCHTTHCNIGSWFRYGAHWTMLSWCSRLMFNVAAIKDGLTCKLQSVQSFRSSSSKRTAIGTEKECMQTIRRGRETQYWKFCPNSTALNSYSRLIWNRKDGGTSKLSQVLRLTCSWKSSKSKWVGEPDCF